MAVVLYLPFPAVDFVPVVLPALSRAGCTEKLTERSLDGLSVSCPGSEPGGYGAGPTWPTPEAPSRPALRTCRGPGCEDTAPAPGSKCAFSQLQLHDTRGPKAPLPVCRLGECGGGGRDAEPREQGDRQVGVRAARNGVPAAVTPRQVWGVLGAVVHASQAAGLRLGSAVAPVLRVRVLAASEGVCRACFPALGAAC